MWYVKGYGLRDVASGAPVDENTIFRFGSVTKEFVAVAILQLASEGKLTITDPVARWYPGITSAGTITVADLL
jgi:CubicO group peptidase (beta-lactamase class C family)